MQAFHPILTAGLFGAISRAEMMFANGFPQRLASDKAKSDVAVFVFNPAHVLIKEAGLVSASALLEKIKYDFQKKIRNGEAKRSLELFRTVLLDQLKDCKLFIAPKDRIAYYNNDRIFGQRVFDAFPSARMDLREAGNCWLFGRNNAVVNHIMYAVEVGLRVLGADRRIELVKKGEQLPLELAQWGEIINKIEEKVGHIKKWPPSLKREQASMFYNKALMEARGFNDGVRRHMAHARSIAYNDKDTIALMGHVYLFLETLAEKMSESSVTDEVWT